MKTSKKIQRGVKNGCACLAEYLTESDYDCANCPMYEEEELEGVHCLLTMTETCTEMHFEGELEIALAFKLAGD